jgi:hypothetical protein
MRATVAIKLLAALPPYEGNCSYQLLAALPRYEGQCRYKVLAALPPSVRKGSAFPESVFFL